MLHPEEFQAAVESRISGQTRVSFNTIAHAVQAKTMGDLKVIRIALKRHGFAPASRKLGNSAEVWRRAAA